MDIPLVVQVFESLGHKSLKGANLREYCDANGWSDYLSVRMRPLASRDAIDARRCERCKRCNRHNRHNRCKRRKRRKRCEMRAMLSRRTMRSTRTMLYVQGRWIDGRHRHHRRHRCDRRGKSGSIQNREALLKHSNKDHCQKLTGSGPYSNALPLFCSLLLRNTPRIFFRVKKKGTTMRQLDSFKLIVSCRIPRILTNQLMSSII